MPKPNQAVLLSLRRIPHRTAFFWRFPASLVGNREQQSSLTTCLQSQIGRDRHLRRQGMAQVEGIIVLSVIVRSGPLRTAVNCTLVARPPKTTPGTRLRRWLRLNQ